ncbi:HNH endonuclease [Salmonella enterica]|nr:HNH endonuclease [Salmonella enterica]EJC3012586.1 HNH endonuclease [Salmonella enterica subsp. enterica serovar Schwarzengrund]ELH3470108.1 HNH endonuclease [Salmonella enterica]EMC0170992.1 HNH endonuclease [Salmonella enterica subsp. enterica serovar Schwarzengrund]
MKLNQYELEKKCNELWAITGYEWEVYAKDSRYIISEYGEVYTTYGKGRILKANTLAIGYKRYKLACGSEYVHRMVAFTFHGDKSGEGLEVDHIDRDKSNNHYSNLRWVTRKENCNNRGNRKK